MFVVSTQRVAICGCYSGGHIKAVRIKDAVRKCKSSMDTALEFRQKQLYNKKIRRETGMLL